MLLNIAWRNIWRNKRRSLVVLSSVVVGVAAILVIDGLNNGMLNQMLYNQISSSVSHLQIHKSGYNDNKVIQSFIPESDKVEYKLQNTAGIEAYSKRVKAFGLVSSAYNSSGVYITGVIASDEKRVSNIADMMVEGSYLTDKKDEIIISKKMAEKLNVKLGSKIVVMASTLDGSPGQQLFKVTGIFETYSSTFDKSNIYIGLPDAQKLLEVGDEIYEFAVIAKNHEQIELLDSSIESGLDDRYEVLNYKELLPMMIMQIQLTKESMMILNMIIGLALIFGIINTMLMSVFERIREFGVLMAIGLKSGRLFRMVVTEALILGIIGTIAGIAAGYLFTLPFVHYGFDFSVFAESLKSFGVGAKIYPAVSFENTISVAIMIPIIAVLGAIYPAYKAVKLQPVYAIRHV